MAVGKRTPRSKGSEDNLEYNDVLEMRTGEMTVDHVARWRVLWDLRVLFISVSQVVVVAL